MATVIMEFVAKNPPSILLLGAILFFLLGDRDIGTILLVSGIFLQILWLVLRTR